MLIASKWSLNLQNLKQVIFSSPEAVNNSLLQHLKAALKQETLVWPSVPPHSHSSFSLFTSLQFITHSLQTAISYSHVQFLPLKILFSATCVVSTTCCWELLQLKQNKKPEAACVLSSDWLTGGESRVKDELTLPKAPHSHTWGIIYCIYCMEKNTPTHAGRARGRAYMCWLDSKHIDSFYTFTLPVAPHSSHTNTVWHAVEADCMLCQHVNWRGEEEFGFSSIDKKLNQSNKQMHFSHGRSYKLWMHLCSGL